MAPAARTILAVSRPVSASIDGAGPPPPAERARRRRALVDHYRLADHTYCSYRAASRYPSGSRPMSENADQDRPNAPVLDAGPMRLQDGGVETGVQLQTSQSRVYLAAGEAVRFALRAVDAAGDTVPLVVTRALAQGITYDGARSGPQVALPFADDDPGDGQAAGDGVMSGVLTGVLAPAQGSLAGFDGTIRTEVRYSAAGKNGVVAFDVVHTPALPALWSGRVREAFEDGALVFYLPTEVRLPGRYVVSGRVDDANGRPFALLTFNDLLATGPGEVRLTVFGKLLHDQAKSDQHLALPLTLRDVDGYLLKENTDPDRALMPRLEGKVYTSKAYALDGFADAEWQSEERTRHLTEFAKDITLAGAALREADPLQPLPASECGPTRQ